MRLFKGLQLGLLMCLGWGVFAFACIWDSDTLIMERQRFPNALELITGKFLRHSPAFYKWRIEDRKKKLETQPEKLDYLDDLAVAYDKSGKHAKAIETILLKNKVTPDLYKTEANLGTFYIHSGEFEKGLKHIERAMEINPDAHFGREKYQALLVKYVLQKRKNKAVEAPEGVGLSLNDEGFSGYVLKTLRSQGEVNYNVEGEEIKAAIKGVLGMMKFGHYDSPVLLEALGDLLSDRGIQDGKHLATRAYLKASYESSDLDEKNAFREKAKNALDMQTISASSQDQLPMSVLEADFKIELQEATRWTAAIAADEAKWIASGDDPEEKFALKYYSEPKLEAGSQDSQGSEGISFTPMTVALGLVSVIALSLFVVIFKGVAR